MNLRHMFPLHSSDRLPPDVVLLIDLDSLTSKFKIVGKIDHVGRFWWLRRLIWHIRKAAGGMR